MHCATFTRSVFLTGGDRGYLHGLLRLLRDDDLECRFSIGLGHFGMGLQGLGVDEGLGVCLSVCLCLLQYDQCYGRVF